MKKAQQLSFVLFTLLHFTACGQISSPVQTQPQTTAPKIKVQRQDIYKAQEIIVKFKGQLTRHQTRDFHAKYGLHTVNFMPQIGTHVMILSPDVRLSVEQVVSYLNQDPNVAYAEVNGSMNAL